MNSITVTIIALIILYPIVNVLITKRVLLRSNVRASLLSSAMIFAFILFSFIRSVYRDRYDKQKVYKIVKLFLFAYPVPVLIFGELVSYEAAKRNLNSVTVNVKIPKINLASILNIFRKKRQVYQDMLADTGI